MDYIAANTRIYDEVADEYEARVKTREADNQDRISRFARFLKVGSKVMDLGCAVGADMPGLEAAGFNVVGVELSPKMAEFARQRNPHQRIICGDFLNIEFEEQFDGIFAKAFIHLFPKRAGEQALAKMYSLLKLGGVALVATNKSDVPQEGWLEKEDYSSQLKRYKKLWTTDELEQSLHSAGFSRLDYYEVTDAEGKDWMAFTVQKQSEQS